MKKYFDILSVSLLLQQASFLWYSQGPKPQQPFFLVKCSNIANLWRKRALNQSQSNNQSKNLTNLLIVSLNHQQSNTSTGNEEVNAIYTSPKERSKIDKRTKRKLIKRSQTTAPRQHLRPQNWDKKWPHKSINDGTKLQWLLLQASTTWLLEAVRFCPILI